MFKAMKAATYTTDCEIKFPVLASPKLDGIRATVQGGQVWSYNGKLIPNQQVQELFGKPEYEGYDGELVYGEPTSPTVFRTTTSFVMARDRVGPHIRFWVFDQFGDEPYTQRYEKILIDVPVKDHFRAITHTLIHSQGELDFYEERKTAAGYEGIMVRSIEGPYKQGRSTVREGYLWKVKRFHDAEAIIVGFEERMHNANEATENIYGNVERSTHKENLVGRGDLGALIVRGVNVPYRGIEFKIGTGFDDQLRQEIWASRGGKLGKEVKYKFFPTGSKDAPRFPVFLNFTGQ